jgi:DNA-binding response OmpR family regulator
MSEQALARNPLNGQRILIVEDEFYLADDLAAALRREGAEVVGPVATIADAERIVCEGTLDCAILDMNLRGEMAFPVADCLEGAGIPYLIATGYNSASLPERFRDVPRVEKPFDVEQVTAALPALLG